MVHVTQDGYISTLTLCLPEPKYIALRPLVLSMKINLFSHLLTLYGDHGNTDKHEQTSMPRDGFELVIKVFRRSKAAAMGISPLGSYHV